MDRISNDLAPSPAAIDIDGGILNREKSNPEGWCARLDTQRSRPRSQRSITGLESTCTSSQPSEDVEKDVEKAAESRAEDTSPPDEWEVQWNGDLDPENPRNLPLWRRWVVTWVVSSASLCVTCTSSIYTSTYSQIEAEFGISKLLAVSGLSLYVIGLGIGPMFLGPLSEFFGRRPIYLISFSLFTLLLIPCALAPSIAVLLAFRFLGGMAGSAFLSVAGGTVGDMFTGAALGAPMMIYTASPFIGPALGPLIGGFINQHTTWRWTYYLLIIWSFLELASLYFLVPETYHPVLLKRRAIALRKSTGNPWISRLEKVNANRSIPRTVAFSCLRPFQLLLLEPMLACLCTFTAILLGVLYLFFQAFPLLFGTVYNFSLSQIGLSFLGLFIGMIAGILSDPYWRHLRLKLISRSPLKESRPEYRLPCGVLGGLLVPIGIFIFALTGQSSIHYIVPIIGTVLFAVGVLLMYSAVFTYTVEAYAIYAASALAANSFTRSCFAAGFPLFSDIMYKNLGFRAAGCTLAAICCPMAPTMAMFFWYGERIRQKSRYAGGL